MFNCDSVARTNVTTITGNVTFQVGIFLTITLEEVLTDLRISEVINERSGTGESSSVTFPTKDGTVGKLLATRDSILTTYVPYKKAAMVIANVSTNGQEDVKMGDIKTFVTSHAVHVKGVRIEIDAIDVSTLVDTLVMRLSSVLVVLMAMFITIVTVSIMVNRTCRSISTSHIRRSIKVFMDRS